MPNGLVRGGEDDRTESATSRAGAASAAAAAVASATLTRASSGATSGVARNQVGPLDTVETSSQIPPLRGRRRDRRRLTLEDRVAYEVARQARRGGQLRAIARSYEAIGEDQRAANVRRCGRVSVYGCVGEGGCGTLHGRRAFQCHDRLCPYCAALRGYLLAQRVRPLVEAMARPVFLTLTVKNGPDLAERGAHLRSAFAKLRRRVAWKAAVAGGIYIEEIVHNGATGEWHVHAHCIVESALLPEQLMPLVRGLWQAITADSYVVDARPLDVGDLREACKYTAKLAGIIDTPALVSVFTAYARNRRMVIPFGSCYGADAQLATAEAEEGEEVPVDVLARPCPACGEVGQLRHLPGRLWQIEDVVHVGDGWYRRCKGTAEWYQLLSARHAVRSSTD